MIGQAELSSIVLSPCHYDSWDPVCGFVFLHVLGVGLVRGGCKRWPCGFVDRPGTGRIGGWDLVDRPEGCWSPTLGLSPYCVPREVICQWMTAEEVLILAINNLRAIWRQLAFWTCGTLTGFWCCHSTGTKKQLSASLFFVRQRLISWLQLEQKEVHRIPQESQEFILYFFPMCFFWGGFDVNNEIFHTALLFPDILGLVFRTCLCYSVLLPTWQFVWQGIPLARMEQEVKAPWFWFVKGSDLGMWLAGSYDSYNDALQGLACDAQSLGHQGAQWAFSCAQLLSWRAPLMRKQLAELRRFHIWFHGRLEAFCFGMCWFSNTKFQIALRAQRVASVYLQTSNIYIERFQKAV